ncbi:MAG TPA: Nramp family divalent metal transporter [Amnibacterium sp.]|nr:Nramp family divalent metal transporter [Amnibacterium sp.]
MVRASRRRSLIRLVSGFGPAFVAAIAYVDPGNVAVNISAGATEGYALIWVLVVANAMAALVQFCSARLGLVTGSSLPELLGHRLSRRSRIAFWLQAEVVAAATDVAEVIGGAVALRLLFGLPLLLGGVIVGGVSLLLLASQHRRGQRTFEGLIVGLLAVLTIGFAAGVFTGTTDWGGAAGGLLPRLKDGGSVLLAASMLGATVMPHAIYLHSSLSRDRHGKPAEDRLPHLLVVTRWDVVVALALAGAVNIALLVVAAANLQGRNGTGTIDGAHAAITAALGPVIGVLFAVGLLASGLASSSVGAYAGSEVMAGLLKVRVPLLTRRLVTLLPAFVLLGIGTPPTATLVLSQVVLSFGIPFAVVPLIRLNSDPVLMGPYVAGRALKIAGWAAAGVVIALNVVLLGLTLSGRA